MKKFSVILSFILLMTFLGSVVHGVETCHVTLTGKIILNGLNYSEVVDHTYVNVWNTSQCNALATADHEGNYSIAFDIPADETPRDFDVLAEVQLKNGGRFNAGDTFSISTIKGGEYKHDFSQEMAKLNVDASFANDNWKNISLEYYSRILQYNLNILKEGTHLIDIPANISFKWRSGYAYPENSGKFDLLQLNEKEFSAKPGETVNLTWDGTFPKLMDGGKIHGTISYSPLPEGTLTQHKIYSESANSESVEETLKADGDYKLDGVVSGDTGHLTLESQFNGRQTLRWPYKYSSGSNTSEFFNLPAGGDKTINLNAAPSIIKGKVKVTGSLLSKNLSGGGGICANGKYSADTYGGSSQDTFDKETGEYCLYLTPGDWNVSGCNGLGFINESDDPMNYFEGRFSFSTTPRAVTVSPGQVLDEGEREIPTGLVTIKIKSSDGTLLNRPHIEGNMTYASDEAYGNCKVYGEGPLKALAETQVTIAALPGTYTLKINVDTQNHSRVELEEKDVVVEKGTHKVVEVSIQALDFISPREIHVNKKTLADVSTTVYGSKPTLIESGTTALVPEKDYSISENNVIIKKGYLEYYFGKFPDQNLYLNITLSDGKKASLIVYAGERAHPEISYRYITYTGEDVKAGCTLSGNFIAAVSSSDSPLVQRIDYAYSTDTRKLIMRKGFIENFFSKNKEDLKLDVKFTGGDVKNITIAK